MPYVALILSWFLTASVLAQAPLRLPPPPRLQVSGAVETAVRLCEAAIEADIVGSEAVTQVAMRFCNPNARVLEGELQFPLLPGQQVIGLSLDIDGHMRAAVPVEKSRGQEVFEDLARRSVDPALLEATGTNQYKLRIYPVPAKGERRVLIRYAETLATVKGEHLFRLPLVFAAPLDRLQLTVRSFGTETPRVAGSAPEGATLQRKGEVYEYALDRRHANASSLLELRIPAGRNLSLAIEQRADAKYFSAEIRLPAGESAGAPRRLPKTVALFWDASGSSSHFDRKRVEGLLDRYFRALGEASVTLLRVRNEIEPGQRFVVRRGDWSELRAALAATPSDGGTNLGAIADVEGMDEQLIVSDGQSNFGTARLPVLMRPSYAIAASAGADLQALAQMVESSGGGVIDLMALDAEAAAAALLDRQARLLRIEGAEEWIAASRLPEHGSWRVAGRLGAAERLYAVWVDAAGREHRLALAIAGAAESRLAGLLWARLRIARLESEAAIHRAEIRRLGETFGLPTRETSLIVLDRVADYLRYGITPPPELRAEFERLRSEASARQMRGRQDQIERVVQLFAAKVAWWERDFPKADRPRIALPEKAESAERSRADNAPRMAFAAAAPASPLASPPPPRQVEASAVAEGGGRPLAKTARAAGAEDAATPAPAVISLKPWIPDAPYMTRLRQARAEDLYRIYLDERSGWEQSSAFFLDVADLLLERGQKELALRVLSNLAEMEIENRALLRILAYRLVQANQAALAVPILERVRRLAPEEPQSHRDLALAYWAAGEPQKAVDGFADIIERPWDARFPEIELIAVAELNALLAASPRNLDTRRIDARLLKNLPLDLRVVLTWDVDNTDIDLWVVDPNGERSYYGNRLSYQGGRMSPDFTGGYGPEEYSLRHAKPGKYRVEVKFYGHRQQVVSGATTLGVRLQTGFGLPGQEERMLTLRLDRAGDGVFVGEFEVPGSGR